MMHNAKINYLYAIYKQGQPRSAFAVLGYPLSPTESLHTVESLEERNPRSGPLLHMA